MLILVAAPKMYIQEAEVEILFSTDLGGIQHSVNRLVKCAKALNKTDSINELDQDGTLFEKDALAAILKDEVTKAIRTQNRIKTFFSVLSTPARNKREIKIIGQMWKLIAGSPDAGDARRWDEAFQQLKKGEKVQTELNSNSAEERRILHTVLDSHTETLHNLTMASLELLQKTAKSENQMESTFFLFSYLSSLENWRDKIESTMYQVEVAYAQGKTGYLSPYVINSTALSTKLLMIETHDRNYRPLFGSTQAHRYFEYPLTSNSLTENALHTRIRVPLLDFNQQVGIFEINRQQKEDSKHDLFSYSYVAKQERGQGYHFLMEQADLDACLNVDDSFVCRKRRARIFGNDRLGDTIIKSLDDTTFLFKLSKEVNATLTCTGETEKVIEVGLSTAYRIPKECELTSRSFEVPKLTSNIEVKQEITFMEIEHPALTLLDKPKPKETSFTRKDTEYELNKERVREMTNLTRRYTQENIKLADTIDKIESNLVVGVATGTSISVFLLVISITALCCLCKHGKTINDLAGTRRIKCCPC